MEKALLFKNFSLRIPELLDRFIIENLTIDFLYNTCYIISGKSGCGKTTLFETVFNNHYSEFYKINTDNVGLITQENQLISFQVYTNF